MIAQAHFSRAQLQGYLDDVSSVDQSGLEEHLESCESCQRELETLATADFDWNDATHLLSASEMDSLPDRGTELGQLARFLQPTERTDSLGCFARFEIIEVLGRGGMGVVMRGFDTSLNRYSAVKVLAPELAYSAAARKRFSREAKSAAAVVHPHVIPIQTVDECDGLPYLVMPVIEGKSLEARVHDSGPLSPIEATRIAAQVAEGLAAAHAQGLVHRDIKPANILLENGVERVQITDFGLARAIDDASMTRSGAIAGTPQYMSPEQAHGDAVDHRSDLFSLGSLIYFMLCGRSPFRAETTMGILNRIVNDQPRSMRSINPEVPPWMEQLVMKLCSKSPEDRYQSATEVAQLLQQYHAHLQQPALHPSPAFDAETSRDEPSLDETRWIDGQPNTDEPTAVPAVTCIQGNGDDGPRWRRYLITAAFAFFAIAGTVIVLETDAGNLRIEHNGDSEVPIRILRGNEVVKEMSVSEAGELIRIKSGRYTIELAADAAEYRVENQTVTISRGETKVATITLVEKQPAARPVSAQQEAPKISPFTAMHLQNSQIFVIYEGKQYELLSIDDLSSPSLIEHARQKYGRRYKKRLSEDLVEVLRSMEHFPGETVKLRLRSLDTNGLGPTTVEDAKMTAENRYLLYRNNEHNQPSLDDPFVPGNPFAKDAPKKETRPPGINDPFGDHSKSETASTASATERINQILSQQVSLNVQNISVKDLLRAASEKYHIPIILDRRNIANVNQLEQAEVQLNIKNVSLRTVLRLALHREGLDFEVRDEIVRVFTKEGNATRVNRRTENDDLSRD